MINEQELNSRIDAILGEVSASLQKSAIKNVIDEKENGDIENISSGVQKGEKEDDEDEDEEEGDEDEDMKKSLILAMEGLQSLVKGFKEKDDKKKKKKKASKEEEEEDLEDHKDVAVKHLCDNKEKDVHKKVALDHLKDMSDMKKSFQEELDLMKSEIERLKSTPIPQKGIPAGVTPLVKSEVTLLNKSEVIEELMTLKKSNPGLVSSDDIMAVELGRVDPAIILKKYKKG